MVPWLSLAFLTFLALPSAEESEDAPATALLWLLFLALILLIWLIALPLLFGLGPALALTAASVFLLRLRFGRNVLRALIFRPTLILVGEILHILAVLIVHLLIPNSLIVSNDILLPDLKNILWVDLSYRLVMSMLALFTMIFWLDCLLFLSETTAERYLLVAAPAKVLLADMAIVWLGLIPIHSVCRVTLRTPDALALSQSQSPCLFLFKNILVLSPYADYAVLTPALKTVGHPLDLVNKLEVIVTNAAYRLFIHVLDPLYVLIMLKLRQIE